MMGVFVQVNTGSKFAKSKPVGYLIQENGCWEWTGCTAGGYGQMSIRRRMVYVHRWMYEKEVGPIPKGLTLDHKCRNRGCCNPAHLEPVTNRTNVLRGEGITARCARKTHCKHGHEFTEENIYPRPHGGRECRACLRRRNMARAGAPQ